MDTFTYPLPPERIAQRPVHPAHDAKLLVIERAGAELQEDTFLNLHKFLRSDDVLVLNNTKVVPARILAKVSGTPVEIFLLNEEEPGVWTAIGRPMKLLRKQVEAQLSNGLRASVTQNGDRELRVIFRDPAGTVASREAIFAAGTMPIPPYIRQGLSDDLDATDYQTYFARVEGSVAAPTASLHFTEQLVSALKKAGITFEFVTLHVGLSSILGLGTEPPGSERCFYDDELISRLHSYKRAGRRIVAVGTTVVRALETFARVAPAPEIDTNLFITPGFDFKFIDALITNFHMPQTTHLLLVEAFLRSRQLLDEAYRFALDKEFRFLSYGDGMIIL